MSPTITRRKFFFFMASAAMAGTQLASGIWVKEPWVFMRADCGWVPAQLGRWVPESRGLSELSDPTWNVERTGQSDLIYETREFNKEDWERRTAWLRHRLRYME